VVTYFFSVLFLLVVVVVVVFIHLLRLVLLSALARRLLVVTVALHVVLVVIVVLLLLPVVLPVVVFRLREGLETSPAVILAVPVTWGHACRQGLRHLLHAYQERRPHATQITFFGAGWVGF
jgi:hypothetical protein